MPLPINPQNPSAAPKPPARSLPNKKGNNLDPKKITFGCGGFLVALLVFLLAAMIFGLRSGEETILEFGLNPESFKNWTIGLLSVFFGLVNLISLIVGLIHLSRFLFLPRQEAKRKSKAGFWASLSFGLLVLGLALWAVVYNYIAKFQIEPVELPVEIITEPAYTYSLTSPIQIDFSAERITQAFKQTHDLVSYEWDRENDGVIDLMGERATFYFPHGGKNNGVFDVTLNLRLQPKDGGEVVVKKYVKKVSIATQEIYGEIISDFESGEVPLAVKLDAKQIRDPSGAAIKNYTWDFDGDGRPEYDGPNFVKINHLFDTIGEHKITLTVTSNDLTPLGRYEEKTFTKVISVRSPEGIIESDFAIQAQPKVGTAPLTVNFGVESKNLTKFDKFTWSIGDSLAQLDGQENSFTFKKPGVYPVTLRATYFNGQVEIDTINIRVNDVITAPKALIVTTPPFARNKKSLSGQAPLEVFFDGSSSQDLDQNIVSYDWDFDGDGYYDETGSQVRHLFWEVGEFKTKLRVRDADLNESFAEVLVQVQESAATIEFGAAPISGSAPLTVNFDASGSRVPEAEKIISYEWKFTTEGLTSEPITQTFIFNNAQTAYTFDRVGEHSAELTLHTDAGTKYMAELKIVATHSAVLANFTASRLRGPAPLAISFDGSLSSGEIAYGKWIFNDGQTATGQKVNHIFEKPGTYEVQLTVYGVAGNTHSTTKIIEVLASE